MRPMRKALAVLALGVVFASFSLLPAVAAEPPQPETPIARLNVGPISVDWLPVADYERLVLTVTGPDGIYIRQEFEAGQAPSFSLFQANGERLPDGTYTYELRVAADIREKLSRTREAGDEYAVRELQRRGKLPERPAVQSGYFSVIDGSLANQGEEDSFSSHSRSRPQTPNLVTAVDQVISDDLIVIGNTCLGIDCANGEVFQGGSSPLKLKQNTIRIEFEDTSTASGFPSNDWRIVINDSQSGGANRFSIEDIDGATTPLTIRAGAPSNSLYVTDSGQLGLGTSTPAAPLHIYGGATADAWVGMGPDPASGPAFNLGYGGASFGRGAAFLNVRPDASATAPNPSLRFLTANVERMIIDNTGRVGIGTTGPSEKVDIFENVNANSIARIQNTNTGDTALAAWRASSDSTIMNLVAHGSGRTLSRFGVTLASRGEILHTNGTGLVIGTLEADDVILGTNNTNRVQINGSTGAVTVSGNLTVNGTFSNPSSRDLKESFEEVDPSAVLKKFASLPINEWSYKNDDRKLRHVGPTVEDFQSAFGLGTEGQYIFPLDVQGVTMAAVQGLYQLLLEKDAQIAELQKKLDTELSQIRKLLESTNRQN